MKKVMYTVLGILIGMQVVPVNSMTRKVGEVAGKAGKEFAKKSKIKKQVGLKGIKKEQKIEAPFWAKEQTFKPGVAPQPKKAGWGEWLWGRAPKKEQTKIPKKKTFVIQQAVVHKQPPKTWLQRQPQYVKRGLVGAGALGTGMVITAYTAKDMALIKQLRAWYNDLSFEDFKKAVQEYLGYSKDLTASEIITVAHFVSEHDKAFADDLVQQYSFDVALETMDAKGDDELTPWLRQKILESPRFGLELALNTYANKPAEESLPFVSTAIMLLEARAKQKGLILSEQEQQYQELISQLAQKMDQFDEISDDLYLRFRLENAFLHHPENQDLRQQFIEQMPKNARDTYEEYFTPSVEEKVVEEPAPKPKKQTWGQWARSWFGGE